MILKIALWLLGALVLVVVLWNVEFQWRLRRHNGMSRDAFLAYSAERGVSDKIASAVYDYYRSRAIWRTFGVAPVDEIAKLFNQDEDDIEDDFTSVLKKLSLEVPYDSAWDARGRTPVRTVEDLVHVLAWAAQNQPSASMAGAS